MKNEASIKTPRLSIDLKNLHLLNSKKGIFCSKCSAHFLLKEYFEQHLEYEHGFQIESEIEAIFTDDIDHRPTLSEEKPFIDVVIY